MTSSRHSKYAERFLMAGIIMTYGLMILMTVRISVVSGWGDGAGHFNRPPAEGLVLPYSAYFACGVMAACSSRRWFRIIAAIIGHLAPLITFAFARRHNVPVFVVIDLITFWAFGSAWWQMLRKNTNADKDMHTKAAMPEDAEIVYAIKVAAYAEYVLRARGSWDEVFQRGYTRKHLPQTRLICVGAEVVGWIACAEDAAKLELIDMHILPAYQKRGFGSLLLVELVARAEAAGKPVELSVLKINPAQALYERFGFRPVGETETHVLMKRELNLSIHAPPLSPG